MQKIGGCIDILWYVVLFSRLHTKATSVPPVGTQPGHSSCSSDILPNK
jgi:hypothetical protein